LSESDSESIIKLFVSYLVLSHLSLFET